MSRESVRRYCLIVYAVESRVENDGPDVSPSERAEMDRIFSEELDDEERRAVRHYESYQTFPTLFDTQGIVMPGVIMKRVVSSEPTASVIYQRWILSDVEAGVSPDGYSLHASKEDHERFVAEHWRAERKNNVERGRPIEETPTVYTTIDGQCEWVECASSILEFVKKAGGSYRGRDRWTRVDAHHRLLTKLMDEPKPPGAPVDERGRTGMFRAVEAELEEVIQSYEKEGADQAVIMTALLSVLGSRVPSGITSDEAVRLIGSLTSQGVRTDS